MTVSPQIIQCPHNPRFPRLIYVQYIFVSKVSELWVDARLCDIPSLGYILLFTSYFTVYILFLLHWRERDADRRR